MRQLHRDLEIIFAVVLSVIGSQSHLLAQGYPTKPIRIVAGFAAGGPTEVIARVAGQKLSDKWGQPVIVETRSGAGGNIAAEYVARAAPDGYTLLLPAFAHAVNPSLYAKLPFDTKKDFAPVALLATSANVLAIHPSIPARSLRELIALAKMQRTPLTYGSAGVATASHLAGELFKSMAGIQITHIPFKGAAPASVDLLGGHISCAFPGVSLVLPHYRSGRMRLIGTTSAQRSATLPEVPTLAEGGLKGFEVISWYGLLAPAALPVELVSRLHHEVVRGLAEVDAIERLQAIGVGASAITTAEFAAFLNREQEKWARVIRSAGLQAQ